MLNSSISKKNKSKDSSVIGLETAVLKDPR